MSSWVALKIVAFNLRLRVCAEVCVHESENWQFFVVVVVVVVVVS